MSPLESPREDALPYGELCLAVYRPDPELLQRQIHSIAMQTLESWTCHIGIDGVDQVAASTILDLVNNDERFRVHHFDDNVGFFRNFERIGEMVQSRAEWVAFADQDDYWYPGKLEELVSHLQDRKVMAVCGQARVVDRQGSLISQTARAESSMSGSLFDNQVTGSLTVFRASVLSVALPFPEPADGAFHDHWLGLTAQMMGVVQFTTTPVQDYVQHGANVVGEERRSGLRERLERLQRSASIGGVVKYLALQRWGWRVRMARILLERVPAESSNVAGLRTAARGSVSFRLLGLLIAAVAKREVPAGRALGLLVGSVGWAIFRLDGTDTSESR